MDEQVKRLTPKKETLRRLFLLSGNQCAFPGCQHPIITEEGNFVGETCHIRAAEKGGERFDPNQSNEERRHFDNLVLMCHDHHIRTDDVRAYPVEEMRRIKADHEKRFEKGLAQMDDIAGINISDSSIYLGGQGGNAPSSGGGGGGAIGPNARGGDGGNSGSRSYLNDEGKKREFDDLSVPQWVKEHIDSTHEFTPDDAGSGGGGSGAVGSNARGGDGGDGGEEVVARLDVSPGQQLQIEIGEGGRAAILPGQSSKAGGNTRILTSDGTVLVEAKGGSGARNASSDLPTGIRELSKADVEAGFRIVVFAPCNFLDIRDGLFFIQGLGWERYPVPYLPIDTVWLVACSIQLPKKHEKIGFYVSMVSPSGRETACQAIVVPEDEFTTLHFGITIGSNFDEAGTWKLLAYSGKYIIAQYSVDVHLDSSPS